MKETRIMLEKIDSIYERVYSINESLSSEYSYYFKKGFEEGINEGLFGFLGKMAGHVVGAAKKAYNWVTGKAEDYWEKGKELAGQAWKQIKSWAEGVLQTTKKVFTTVINGIAKGLKWIWDTIVETIGTMVRNLGEVYKQLKDKAEALANCVMKIISDIGQQITEFASGVVKFFKDLSESAGKKYLEDNIDKMKDISEDLKKSDVPEVKSIGQQAGEMIASFALAIKKGAQAVGKGVVATGKAIGQGALGILKFTGALAIVIVGGTIDLVVRGVKSIPGAISWVYDKTKELLGKMYTAISKDWNSMFTEFDKAKKSWEPSEKTGAKDYTGAQSQVQKEKEEIIKDSFRYLKSFNRF